MTSKRTRRRLHNLRPFWNQRVTAAQQSAPDAAALQYDLARTHICRIALLRDRDTQWTRLAERIDAFNARFVGVQPDATAPGRRLSSVERRFKAATNAVDKAARAYDISRFYLRRIDNGDDQEQQWRELAAELARFNERFTSAGTPSVSA